VPILARILKDRGIVTERQMQEAIQHQVLYGGRLGTSLYELGFITEERLQTALGRAHGVPTVPIDPKEIKAETIAVVPKSVAARYKVFPYRLRGKTLDLLMVDPQDHGAVAKVGYSLGFIVRPHVVPEFRMIQLLHDYYDVDERWRYTDTHRPPAPSPNRLEPTDESTAANRIDTATTRDEIVDALIALCLRSFRRVVFFIVREPWVLGWNGGGEGMDRALAASLRIPLDRPSVFQTATRSKSIFVGRLPAEEENQRFMKAIAKRPLSNAVLFPVAVRGRVVNLVFGDSGASGNVKPSMGDLLVLTQKASRAYLRIIRKRVAETRKATGAEAGNGEKESS
jgi:hypothetical protein